MERCLSRRTGSGTGPDSDCPHAGTPGDATRSAAADSLVSVHQRTWKQRRINLSPPYQSSPFAASSRCSLCSCHRRSYTDFVMALPMSFLQGRGIDSVSRACLDSTFSDLGRDATVDSDISFGRLGCLLSKPDFHSPGRSHSTILIASLGASCCGHGSISLQTDYTSLRKMQFSFRRLAQLVAQGSSIYLSYYCGRTLDA
jgi:hypothetical protein